jgi:L-alanine-DL-glutamate epimerase-like enolase superfamily enzyme
MASNLDTA